MCGRYWSESNDQMKLFYILNGFDNRSYSSNFHFFYEVQKYLTIIRRRRGDYRGIEDITRRCNKCYLRVVKTKILFSPPEDKIHIFKPPCNILFII